MQLPLFRLFWLASLASNLGTWIHEVGASWLMTDLVDSPVMVAAVRTSMSLPILLFALPAGVLADRLDRRRLLILTQLMMFSVAATMAGLSWAERITPWGLLFLTTLMGMGMVLHVPMWQASTPELVPRRLLPQAVAMGSISFNLARSAGPALGGILVGSLGAWAAFAMNACSFAGVLVVLGRWKRTRMEHANGQTFGASMAEGLRFVTGDQTMRHVLLRVVMFVLPASAMWSQLPLIARYQLQWGSTGFGLLIGGLGIGAVLAATQIDWVRQRLGSDRLLMVTGIVFAALVVGLALSTSKALSFAVIVPLGACWMIVLTTLNATAQMTLPRPLRARGMACYLMSLALGMSGGSMLWGQVAEVYSPATSVLVAAAMMPVLTWVARNLTIGTALTD
ncbi:MFS transporter [Roseimaritima sediminicola]|uniref:MFS transporter n=1 Tax=Roseimaritima sediminicola TaxID=2662066 RepID=UPI0012983B3F|nr:MFS transporter [Roseimaritima sediminicola]